MRSINILTLILVIVGGLNWGLVGLFEFDLVARSSAPARHSPGSSTSSWASRRSGRSAR